MHLLDDCVSIDLEATSYEPELARITQFGLVPCSSTGLATHLRKWVRMYINPGAEELQRMGPDVIGVTSITPAILRMEGETLDDLRSELTGRIGPTSVIVGHNYGRFDRVVLANERLDFIADRPYIDTYRVIQEFYDVGPFDRNGRVLPDMKLGTCFYGIVPEDEWDWLDFPFSPHDALYDAGMVARLLEELVVTLDCTIEDMIALSRTPFAPRVCWLGKYRGVKWADVPNDFLSWMASKQVWEKDEGREIAVLQEMESRGMLG